MSSRDYYGWSNIDDGPDAAHPATKPKTQVVLLAEDFYMHELLLQVLKPGKDFFL